MTVFFAGSEDIDVVVVGANIQQSTTGGGYDSTYARAGIRPAVINCPMQSPAQFAPTTNAWLHFYAGGVTYAASAYAGPCFGFNDASNAAAVMVIRSTEASPQGIKFRFNDGTGNFVDSPEIFIPVISGLDVDFHVEITGTTIKMELYVAGDNVASYTGTLVTTYALTNFCLYLCKLVTGVNGVMYSQIVMADEPTVGMKVFTRPPTSNGAVQEFTGSYADIDEIDVTSADSISTPSAARSSFKRNAITLTGTQTVRAISVSSHGNSFTDSAATVNTFLRISSTNYDGSTSVLSAGNTKKATVWNVDPSTGLKWDDTLVKGTTIEFGVKVA